MSIGTAFLVVYYIGMLACPLESIREQAQNLQQASASIARIGELLAIHPRVVDTPRAALPAGALAVAFNDVSFEYDDERRTTNDERPASQDDDLSSSILRPPSSVLSDVSFTLTPGTKLGLLGRTGSGKAQNGQDRGLFQMGSYERQLFGHGDSAHAQAVSAHRYFVRSGRDWSPWSCRWAAA